MALINCPECNNQVSDSAVVCPQCGYRLKPKMESEPIKEEKSSGKSIKPLLIGCIVVVAIIALVLVISKSNGSDIYDKNGHVRNLAWGTSKSDVEELLEKENGEAPNSYSDYLSEHVQNFGGLKDYEATVMYQFEYGGLSQAVIMLESTDEYYDVETLFKTFQDKLCKVYGNYDDSMISGSVSTWHTSDTEINLIWYNDYCVMIGFEED